MASIPIVLDLTELLLALGKELKGIPAAKAKARKEILKAVTDLSEAVSQALNVVSIRCGEIILSSNNLPEFRKKLVNSPSFLTQFRLAGVCSTLGNVRAELRTILNAKTFAIGLFSRNRLKNILDQIQKKERDLEEDFDSFFRDLSRRGTTIKKNEIPEIVEYLRECQSRFEEDVKTIRSAMRHVENTL